jgi:hypothetical protein
MYASVSEELDDNPEDEGRRFFLNTGKYLPD